MKRIIKNTSLGITLGVVIISFGFTMSEELEKKGVYKQKKGCQPTINMFVTHGHCSTPFMGRVNDLRLEVGNRTDGGNPLENMKISFEVNPNTFNVCSSKALTKMIRTPGLFVGKNEQKITFRTTNVYTMGLDWYQLNGKLAIKGVERAVKFFVTGIRTVNASSPSSIVLEGHLNLLDWGIDYDLLFNGRSDSIPTKLLYLNMKFDVN